MTCRKLLAAASAAFLTVSLGLVANTSAADKYEVIYNFPGLAGGSGPAGLISDAAGNLYGTASGGPDSLYGDKGVVFKLSHNASGKWSESVLHTFQGKDGTGPSGGLVIDKDGNVYGTTSLGGGYNSGLVFKLAPELDGKWSETVLHSFQGTDGVNPNGDLVFDKAGNLYGTTNAGGGHNLGLVFKLAPELDGKWSETVLHSFQGTDGANPNGGLIFDRAGNLYGTTYSGGTHNNGTVFKLSPDADGEWTETVLHSFQGSPDGANPDAGLIFDRVGNLYGPTYGGGTPNFGGYGTVFKLSPELNGEWTETVLHSFQAADNLQAPGGFYPEARLTFDRAGNLYGTTFFGGSGGAAGVVFKLSPELNGRWIETVMRSFQGYPDGGEPMGTLIIDSAGHLYGTTTVGGNSGNCFIAGCGTVFQITP
ncbi:MAG TPA: choice-of-anchor tandem repeat GloVer-containing protein [Terriglobales bacterium]